MALNIRNKEAEQLARVRRERGATSLADRLVAIGRECAALPVFDERDDDEILGYDERGLPS